MWEVLHTSPHGRISLRKYIIMAASLLVAYFGYLFATVPMAHALTPDTTTTAATQDATWVDEEHIKYDGITYQGHYEKTASGDWLNNQIDIPVGSTYYWAKVKISSGQLKLNLLYFDAGTNFLTASTVTQFSYDVTPDKPPATTSTLSNSSARVLVNIAPRAPPASSTGSTSCSIDGGLSWIICPLTRTLAGFMDKIYSFISQFLAVQPLNTTNATNTNPMYVAWGYMRNIANVAFIIAFLIIIYSQVTNVGMSNYGLKKILPRIVISAILVNVSYWICAIAIDITNILGYSIQDLFVSVRNSLVVAGHNTFDPMKFTAGNIADLILGGGAVAAGVGIGGFLGITTLTAAAAGGFLGLVGLFLPMLIGLLFVVIMTFIILAARQALIIIFVVVAPLAFVAYLLPNTEKWFDKWRDTFFTLLIVFPGFSVVFGGSQLAAALIIQAANDANAPIMILLAWGVQLAPLAITPILLRLGGGVLNRVAGVVNNPTKGIFDRGRNWANDRRDEAISRGHRRISALENQGRLGQFGVRRMTYNRQRNKMAREGEKAANDALTKGYFSQTAAARRISTLDKRAHLEQEIGDNESEAAWNQAVWNRPGLRGRALRAHDAHERSGLYKQRLDAEASEHWQHTLDHNAALNAINTQSHLATGRAKLAEDARTNAAELALRQQISSTRSLRDLSINSQSLKSQAELFQKEVDAAAKENWANILASTPNLRLMNRDATMAEGRADIQMEGLQAEANRALQWQVNQNVGGLRDVKVQQAVDAATAEFFKKNVDAEGSQAFQDTFFDDSTPAAQAQARQLRLMNVDTVAREKEAAARENTLAKRAEANWNTLGATDADIQEIRAQEFVAERSAEAAENRVKSMFTDMQLHGRDGLAAGGPQTATTETMADNIQRLRQEANINRNRMEAAEDMIKSEDKQAWAEASETDADTQALRVRQDRLQHDAAEAEQTFDTRLENIRALGAIDPNTGDSLVLDPANNQEMVDDANAIGESMVRTRAMKEAQAAAEYMQKRRYTKEVRDDQALRDTAGGIDPRGSGKVYARVTKEMGDILVKDSQDYASILSNEGYTQQELLDGLTRGVDREGNAMPTEGQYGSMMDLTKKAQHITMLKMVDNVANAGIFPLLDDAGKEVFRDQAGNEVPRDAPGARQAYYVLNEPFADNPDHANRTEFTDLEGDTATAARDRQQILHMQLRESGREFDNVSNTDMGVMINGMFVPETYRYEDNDGNTRVHRYTTQSEAGFYRNMRGDRLSDQKVAKMDIDQVIRYIEIARNASDDEHSPNYLSPEKREQLKEIVEQVKDPNNPRIKSPDKRVIKALDSLVAVLDQSDERPFEDKISNMERKYSNSIGTYNPHHAGHDRINSSIPDPDEE